MKTLFFLSCLSLLSACATQSQRPFAGAQLVPTHGNSATGWVSFTQSGSSVLVMADISGLKPNAEHGFHIHDKGDCSSGDGMSAGGHFNPTAQAHGAHGAASHHAGDLPSLVADKNGVAKLKFETSSITIDAGLTNIAGRGLIVHRDPDDFRTQPTGNAGPRLACAVIVKG
jgi:Cu-Zn family superoxide dismutase